MFRKTEKGVQFDIFGSVASMLESRSLGLYSDKNHWHNQFHHQILNLIDESCYRVLFSEKMGAPNASISVLIGMMILKDSFGWSDAQLYEHARFDLLTRSALGLVNINATVPTESTYYLFRKRLYDYELESGEDLLSQTFAKITGDQIREFQVNGREIRMDSKLIGSNIAYFSRYELIHHSLVRYCRTLDSKLLSRLTAEDRECLASYLEENPGKVVYENSREEIQVRLRAIGSMI